jgi:hypothetical protein
MGSREGENEGGREGRKRGHGRAGGYGCGLTSPSGESVSPAHAGNAHARWACHENKDRVQRILKEKY